MKLIKELVELIEEEVEGVENYAELALAYKEERPALAEVLYRISQQEANHVDMLHEQIVHIIDQHRKEKGEPPAAMMAVYDFMHRRHIDKMKQARTVQAMYK